MTESNTRSGTELTFQRLRETNLERCADVFHPLASWSLTDWGCAMGGEGGEVLNIVKKIHRGDIMNLHQLGDELADLIIYADLLAARAGIDLSEAVVRKFNRVSDERGSTYKL